MGKDFTEWHKLKTNLQKAETNAFFHEREIWLCSVGMNLGREEDGKNALFLRPVVVFRKFGADSFWGIPLTSTLRIGSYYYQFPLGERTATAMLAQMRLFDRKRFIRRMDVLSDEQFNELKVRVAALMPEQTNSLQDGRESSEAEAKVPPV